MSQKQHPDSTYSAADYERMLSILGVELGDEEQYEKKSLNDVTAGQVAQLLSSGLMKNYKRHNHSPTGLYFLDFMTRMPVTRARHAPYRLEGYAVPPIRHDCRVSITGIRAVKELDQPEQGRFAGWFLPGGDDEWKGPVEPDHKPLAGPNEWTAGPKPRAWWD